MYSPDFPASANSVLLHEGYLFKTPPLDKFFMSWKKRWFVLSQRSPLDPSSLDLSYYSDSEKKEKKGSINLQEVKCVNPVYNKSKGDIFSLETTDQKFVLRSPDERGKGVWVAKLLEGCSKDGTAFHVTVPDQPTAVYSEGVLKVSTPLKVNIISSLNGNVVMSIPFEKIRRFGCQIAVDRDIVWFETCSCQAEGENFAFFIVASGIEKAYQIVMEYKRSFELGLRDHMIMEEGDQSKFFYSFVVRSHYGHTEFSHTRSNQILSSSLLSLSASGGSLSQSDLNRLTRSRSPLHMTEASRGRLGPVPGLMDMHNTPTSPTAHDTRRGSSPLLSPSPISRMSLGDVHKSSRVFGQYRSASTELYLGAHKEMSDPSRSSAPCSLSKSLNTNSTAWKKQKTQKITLQDIKKGMYVNESHKGSFQPRKTSLSQLQKDGGLHAFKKTKSSKDKLSSNENLSASPYSKGDGGAMAAAYDHLVNGIDNISVQHSSRYQEAKTGNPAYVES